MKRSEIINNPTREFSVITRSAKLSSFAQSIYDANPINKKVTFMDITNEEVKEFLMNLVKFDVKYMLVGGVATIFHGYVRTTQDLDLWVKETPENKAQLVKALNESNVSGADNYLTVPMIPGYSTVTIGTEGFVVDFMDHMKAFKKEDFDICYSVATHTKFDDVPITVIHLNHLIEEKITLGRHKDLDDVENLKKIYTENKKSKGDEGITG